MKLSKLFKVAHNNLNLFLMVPRSTCLSRKSIHTLKEIGYTHSLVEQWPEIPRMLPLVGWFVIHLENGYWALIIIWVDVHLLRQNFEVF